MPSLHAFPYYIGPYHQIVPPSPSLFQRDDLVYGRPKNSTVHWCNFCERLRDFLSHVLVNYFMTSQKNNVFWKLAEHGRNSIKSLTIFVQATVRSTNFLMGWLLGICLKEDPVKCVRVCDESVVILPNLLDIINYS